MSQTIEMLGFSGCEIRPSEERNSSKRKRELDRGEGEFGQAVG